MQRKRRPRQRSQRMGRVSIADWRGSFSRRRRPHAGCAARHPGLSPRDLAIASTLAAPTRIVVVAALRSSLRFHSAADALGNPLLLRAPLEAGVRVIAAHCASEGHAVICGHEVSRKRASMIMCRWVDDAVAGSHNGQESAASQPAEWPISRLASQPANQPASQSDSAGQGAGASASMAGRRIRCAPASVGLLGPAAGCASRD